jgi:hypothetical protein
MKQVNPLAHRRLTLSSWIAVCLVVVLAFVAVAECTHVHSVATESSGHHCLLCIGFHAPANPAASRQVSAPVARCVAPVLRSPEYIYLPFSPDAVRVRPPPAA